jgi:hypothetical protein
VEEDTAKPVEASVWIRARPETVYAFLIEPEKLVQWIGLTAALEPRPGGLFRVDMNGRTVVRGEYLALEPPRRRPSLDTLSGATGFSPCHPTACPVGPLRCLGVDLLGCC